MSRILSKEEIVRYPNLYEFLDEKCVRCHGRSRVRCIRFAEGEAPDFAASEALFSGSNVQDDTSEEAVVRSAQVLIIENADADTLQRILETRISRDDRLSFLQFLDSYLHDQPSFNFDNIERQLPPMPSTLTSQQFVTFSYVTAREFDVPFTLGYAEVETAGRRAGSWRALHTWGPMNPVQRYDPSSSTQKFDLGGVRTPFPPLAITRTRAAAWFNRDGVSWSSACILVDEMPRFVGTRASLKPSFLRIGSEWYRGYTSGADLLAEAMKRNVHLQSESIPSPLLVVQDLYRLVAFEWSLFLSYHARDLNSIEWVLQYGDGDEKIRPEMLKQAMRDLFMSRRRVPLYVNFVRDQLSSCRPEGRRSWSLPDHDTEAGAVERTKIAGEELVNDFSHIERQMTQLHERLDASMAHIAGQTNILEAQRTHELNQITVEQNKIAFAQNKILLALALVGTFFLPINAIAAIFSMGGRWAAGENLFPIFWAICIPISLGLVSALLLFMHFGGVYGARGTMPKRLVV